MEVKDKTAPAIDPAQPMHDTTEERLLTTDEARQAETPNIARKVLAWSLVLVIIAFAAVYVWSMLTPTA